MWGLHMFHNVCPKTALIFHEIKKEQGLPLTTELPTVACAFYCVVAIWQWDKGAPPVEDRVGVNLLSSKTGEGLTSAMLTMPKL